MNDDQFWQQVDNEERRRYEEEEQNEAEVIKREWDAFNKRLLAGRPGYWMIDQDENWIMKVTKCQ